MYCLHCGTALPEDSKFCWSCGNAQKAAPQNMKSGNGGSTGFSPKINDPAFKKYIKNTKRWSAIFSFILALAAVIGFFIYGETSSEMDNPEALYIGLGIGAMFVVIAMFQIIGRNRSTTWDGVIVDKKIEQKSKRRYTSQNDYYWQEYTLFTVFIRGDNDKMHTSSAEDDDTVYNYYQLGDKVRHHGGLNSYEKYDKSRDTITFCNACATLNDISDEVCFRCKCPLLK